MPQKRMSIEHAARVFRALRGEWSEFPDVTFEEVEGLDVAGETFSEFIDRNWDHVQFFEEAVI